MVKRELKDIEPVLQEVKEILKELYEDRLVDIVLYGSFAKEKATSDSDIDVAVILGGEVNKGKEIDRICDVIYPVELKYDELISVNPISEKDIDDTGWPLYKHINTEGIKV